MIHSVSFRYVSLFPKEEFGIREVSFTLRKGNQYHLILENEDKLNTLLGILEKRYRPHSGVIRREENDFVQSDRLLLGDKVYSQTVEKRLGLGGDFFHFEGRKRSKHYFVDLLKAKSITWSPIHRLRGEEKIKFTLLSLFFQRSGLILIRKLHHMEFADYLEEAYERLINNTHCTLCFLSTREEFDRFEPTLPDVEVLEIKEEQPVAN